MSALNKQLLDGSQNALANIVIVVESHARGGSMHTVTEAERRGVPVMAVPGPIHSPSAEGTNALLRDGCAPVSCVTATTASTLGSAASFSTASRMCAAPVNGDVARR